MRVLAIVCTLCACTSPSVTAPGPSAPAQSVQADEPSRPALRLPTHFKPTGYVARLAIDPAKPRFTGHIEITGELAKTARVIWLRGKGLVVKSANGTNRGVTVPVVTKTSDDLVELRATNPFAAGTWTFVIDYDGGIDQDGFSGAYAQKYANDVYVSTQFEATAARLVFPCLDEPGFKAPWQLSLDVPTGLVAISNTPGLRTDPLDATHVRVLFGKTRPLPSYLIAFAVGPWDLVDAGTAKTGAPIRMVVPRGQSANASYAAEVVPKMVRYLEDWFGIPFPYPKLDVVAVPSLRGGAMENAGMITYDSRNMLNDPTHPSWSSRYNVVDTLGHEISHQWFGDLVTATWWDDIWLNESFATWMEDRIVHAIEPSWHADQVAITRRNQAFGADSLASARQIRQPIENEGDIHNAFDNITYPKGASVLRMFEHHLGPDKVREAVHAYLVAHSDGSATAADLLGAIDTATGTKSAAAFASFLDQAGVPMIEVDLECPRDKPPHVLISQHRYLPAGASATSDDRVWKMPVCIAFDNAGKRGETCQLVDTAAADIPLPTTKCPAWSFADAGGFGYYRLAVTEAEAQRLRDVAWPNLDEAERRSVFEAVRNYALDGKLAIATLTSFVPKLLAIDDRFGVGDALGDFASGGFGPLGTGLPASMPSAIAPTQLAQAQARVRASVGPLVARLGITVKPSDTFDDEARRGDVVSAAMWARDHRLDKDAVSLAKHWRDLAPGQRRLVLWLAVNASPEIEKQLRTDAFAELDPEVRQELLAALGSLRDPKRHRDALSLMLDDRLSAEDALAVMNGYVDDLGRAEVEAFLREHMAELVKKFPTGANDDFPIVLNLAGPIVSACDVTRRDDIASYVTEHFAKVPSGARPIQQAIESLDQCIARRKRLEPSIKAWLHQ